MKVNLHGQEFEVLDHPFWADAVSGKWEPYTFEVLAKYVSLHKTYLDIGAWIGPTALFASRFCEHVIAFEPDPVAFEILEQNLEKSKAVVFPMNSGIMDYQGELLLGCTELGNSMARIGSVSPSFQLAVSHCNTLPEIFSMFDVEDPVFIKMDTEGAEEFILKDKEFFAKHKPTLYLSTHPFWFRHQDEAAKTIDEIGKLYKHRIEVSNNTFLFTDLDNV